MKHGPEVMKPQEASWLLGSEMKETKWTLVSQQGATYSLTSHHTKVKLNDYNKELSGRQPTIR